MRLSLLLAVLALSFSISATAARTSRETSIADIRQYQAQLAEQVESGKLKKLPKATKATLKKRSDALSVLLQSPTAGTDEAELARIGQEFVKLQTAAEKASQQVVRCRRVATLGSRLGAQECRSVEDIEAEAERARTDMTDRQFNDIQNPGE